MMFSKELTRGDAGITKALKDIMDQERVYGDNRDFASVDTVAKINNVLRFPGVRDFAKEVLREGLTKDSLDAVYDVKLALACLEEVLKGC